MRIPTHLRIIADRHSLRSWFNGKQCPREKYFRTVDELREAFKRYTNRDDDQEPGPDSVAHMMARFLDHEGALYAYVADDPQQDPPPTEDGWYEVCHAAGWVIVAEHQKAFRSGKWPTT